ncbi:sigma factor [Saccharothrix obliqua]|uniref:sigma factor n=1 Tax=Saccharothrix obliqua TaxID=2861747 RepID=UPI001C603E1D|nr:sigma factor [Saccharothrix obliqua]MBW4715719.1 hypothetical protein [Saccharothrix obliqua]
MMADGELSLLHRLRAGDSGARRELFSRCQGKTRAYVRNRVDRPEDVDDVVSEVVVRALEGLRNGQDPRDLDAWLTGIARNVLKAHYTDQSRRSDREVPDSAVVPEEVEDLVSRDRVRAVLSDSLAGVPAGLRPVVAAHIRLTLGSDHLVVGAELAEALGVRRSQADRQLDRGRRAAGKAIAAYVMTRVGRERCEVLAALTDRPFDPKQPDVVLAHAEMCAVCGQRQRDARDYARWALGPGLLGLPDEEDRRTALGFAGRGGESPRGGSGVVGAGAATAAPQGVGLDALADRAEAAPRGVLGAVGARLAAMPGVDAVTRLTQENPALVRVAAGAVGLVAAAVIAVLATAPDPVQVGALPPTSTPTAAPPALPGGTTAPSTAEPPDVAPVVATLTPPPTATAPPRTTPPTTPPAVAPQAAATPQPASPPPVPPTPEPTPEATPEPTTPAPPPAAKWAYARVEPADSAVGVETDLIGTWQWGTPRPIRVTRQDTGVYRLRLPGQASGTAVAHATPTFHQPPQPVGCVVRDNGPVGEDQVVLVACANDGTPVNTRFTLLLAEPSGRTTVIGPDAPVRRVGPGRYEADLAVGTGRGYVQVTPYGPGDARCRSEGVTGAVLHVQCTADTRWAAGYTEGGPPAGTVGAYAQTTGVAPDLRIDPGRSFNSTGGAFALNRLGLGQYRVLVKGVGTRGGAVLSGATGAGHCYTANWNAFAYPVNEVWVDVQCLDDAGRPADLQFGVAAYRPPLLESEALGPLQPADPGPARPGWGYAQVYQYGYALGVPVQVHPNHQWSTWSGHLPGNDAWWARKASVLRTGVGEYAVRMPGLGVVGAVAHVTAISQVADVCVVRDQAVDGPDGVVGVNCYGPAGVGKDLPFHVYLGTGPAVTSSSEGVTRLGVGEYEVVVPGGAAGFVQVTPVGGFARCRGGGTAEADGVRLRVSCDRDTAWQASHVVGTGLSGDGTPAGYATVTAAGGLDRVFSSNGETPVVTHEVTGRYTITYSTLGNRIVWPTASVQVTTTGSEPRTCRAASLNAYSTPGAVRLDVWCHDPAGRPADAAFAFTLLRPPDR